MTGISFAVRTLLMAGAIQLSCAALPALAAESGASRCGAGQGSLDAALRDDGFYQQVVHWQGLPASCKGSAGQGDTDGESRLALAWRDGSTFEQASLLPETSIIRYGRPAGLAHADEVIAALHAYAAGRGLHVDWASPHRADEGGARIIEYQDPGVNGIARLSYDRRGRLVAVSLGIAL